VALRVACGAVAVEGPGVVLKGEAVRLWPIWADVEMQPCSLQQQKRLGMFG
jgi:hypothetical protein